MTTGLIVLIVVGCVLVCVGFTLVILRARRGLDRRYRAAVEQLSRQVQARGWQYAQRDEHHVDLLPPYWVGHRLQRERHAKYVDHLITGSYRDRFCFAGIFQLPSGNPQCIRGIGIRLPASVPRMRVTAHRLHRGEPGEFADHYEVEGENERFTADVLGPELRDWLLRDPSGAGLGFWTLGDWLYLDAVFLVGNSGGTSDVSGFPSLLSHLDFLCGVFDRIPEVVWTRA